MKGAFSPSITALCLLLSALGLGTAAPQGRADQILVPTGATWKFLDNGTDQGTTWRSPAFNDASWASGAAELGYGDGGEATILSYGTNSSSKYITTYFRKAFNVADPGLFASLKLRVIRDDGIVVYLNGNEIFRDNMPAGTPNFQTLAPVAIAGADESTFIQQTGIPVTGLVAGNNTLAVEIHQQSGTSSDISFNLELTGVTTPAGPVITRGPYLQNATPNAITIRWRTDVATDSRVQTGPTPGNWTSTIDDPALTTEHRIRLTGLAPNTPYYYSIGSTTASLASGAGNVFYTPPTTGTRQPYRIWVIGDAGTGTSSQVAVRDAYYNANAGAYTDLWLMLGDNAYNSGTDAEYQTGVFNMYGSILAQSPVWSTLGNHDTAGLTTADTNTLPYFQIFELPAAGEAGGVPSGTEKYYSFNYGNIHFVCLDSMTSDRSPSGPMLTWLNQDLSANSADWLIAFWHHPPYTKGSHDSDTESQLIEMRQNALPILENHGVDLVLSGHSHSYERSFLIDSHYGVSSTFGSLMLVDGGSGRTNGTGAYTKTGSGPQPHQGAVYAVAGSSGQTGGGTLNHPAMYVSLNVLGSMILDLDGDRLDATFLTGTGTTGDYFTIVKNPPANNPPSVSLTAPSNNASFAAPATVSLAANAADSDGTVASVAFFAGSTLLATDSTAPYEFSWSNVPAGNYALKAVATDNLGLTATSSVVNISVTNPPVVPNAPTSLTATAQKKLRIQLAWKDNANNETGFKVERSVGGVTWTEIATLGANVTSYTSTGLTAGTTYSYRVRAYNAAGNSAYSNTASAKAVR